MAAAIIYGASSGALHAVTGPDHVLSLGPEALRARRGALRVGLVWGLGHGVGTLILAIPLLVLARAADAERLASVGDRVAAALLVASGLFSLWRVSRPLTDGEPATRSPLWVGFVHGATGAGSLTLILPAVVSADARTSSLFMVAFALGGTLAMGALTAIIGRAGERLAARHVQRFQQLFALAAVGVGGALWCV